MPIEIRELVIRAFVEPTDSRITTDNTDSVTESDKITAESLEQILEIIKNKNER